MQKTTSKDTGTKSFLNLIQKVGDEALKKTVSEFKKPKKHTEPKPEPTAMEEPWKLTEPSLSEDITE